VLAPSSLVDEIQETATLALAQYAVL
jgi:hypothetical protein